MYSSLIHFPMPDEPEDLARQFVNDNVFGDNENIIKCLFLWKCRWFSPFRGPKQWRQTKWAFTVWCVRATNILNFHFTLVANVVSFCTKNVHIYQKKYITTHSIQTIHSPLFVLRSTLKPLVALGAIELLLMEFGFHVRDAVFALLFVVLAVAYPTQSNMNLMTTPSFKLKLPLALSAQGVVMNLSLVWNMDVTLAVLI